MVPDHRIAFALASRSIAFLLLLPSLLFACIAVLVASALAFVLPGSAPLVARGADGIRLPASLAARDAGGGAHLTAVYSAGVHIYILGDAAVHPKGEPQNGLGVRRVALHGRTGESGLSGPCWVVHNFSARGASDVGIGESDLSDPISSLEGGCRHWRIRPFARLVGIQVAGGVDTIHAWHYILLSPCASCVHVDSSCLALHACACQAVS